MRGTERFVALPWGGGPIAPSGGPIILVIFVTQGNEISVGCVCIAGLVLDRCSTKYGKMWCELAEMELNGRYTHARFEQKMLSCKLLSTGAAICNSYDVMEISNGRQGQNSAKCEGRSRPVVVNAVTGWRTHCVQLLHYRLDLPSSLKR
jgi:hypothetical protein